METEFWASCELVVVRLPFLRPWCTIKHSVLISLPSGDILIDEETLAGIRTLVERSGVKLKTTGDVEAGGWTGGAVWLVPTDQPIEDWHPIATRAL